MVWGVVVAALLALACAASAEGDEGDVGYFWQVTDLHWQPAYVEGSSRLQECLRGSGDAGPYGSLANCDIPEATLRAAFEFMTSADQPAADFVLYTGDIVPHNPLDMDEDGVIAFQQNITYYMRKYFPDVPTFPLLGNHDSYPRFQMYATPYWLYERTAEAWSPLLSPYDAVDTFTAGGRYSAKVHDGLRIIGINTAVYYRENDYVNGSETDPGGQLSWLSGVLANAESAGERVLLAYHVPVGFNAAVCQMHEQYNEQLVKMFRLYSSIIVAHFSGHTHLDFYRLVGDLTPSDTSVAFTAGSLTSRDATNPRVRLFKYKRSAPFTLLDYQSYMLDLRTSNSRKTPMWSEEYRASTEYSLADLTVSSMIDLYQRLSANATLFSHYMSHWKGVDGAENICDLDSACGKTTLCDIAYTLKEPLAKCLM
eukprot:TRINITY_DN6951_c0_g1_i1.p1 TRINITY_DN6951_c0_g1~~TRINITY_DN6951_c0_g1_i1.p1  ORF type:complete len:425 (-),score=105.24 TRINITY_DN6951_c0_g1_i1:65-1339(-)